MPSDLPFDPYGGEPARAQRANVGEFTVSELSFALKRTLEDTFGYVRVRGEISGFRGPHSSGHCYFTLKDDKAALEAVIWRTNVARLRSKLSEGLEVIATGRITTYPNSSKYQIVIESLEPAGVGALMALLEERRKKLAAEGLFEAGRKRRLPFLPGVIGVVTSPTGAVIRDILHRLADRFPRRVLLWPVRVQGETSAREVEAAIRGFNSFGRGGLPKPDVIIVARGGGSLEDLWSFNEEIVVRAAAASAIPIISAVGHETDWTLIDHVADMRAPTPTAAAELAVPVRADLMAAVEDLGARRLRAIGRLSNERLSRLSAAARGLPRPDDILALARQRFDSAAGRLGQALRMNTQRHRAQFERAAGRHSPRPLLAMTSRGRELLDRQLRHLRRAEARLLEDRKRRLAAAVKLADALSYRSVLRRGFALVRDSEKRPIYSVSEVQPADGVTIQFQDGEVEAVIGGGGVPPGVRRRRPPRTPSSDQGSLF